MVIKHIELNLVRTAWLSDLATSFGQVSVTALATRKLNC